jgi:hypothetical protein
MKINDNHSWTMNIHTSPVSSGINKDPKDSVTLFTGKNTDPEMVSKESLARIVNPMEDPYLSDINSWNPAVEKRLDEFLQKAQSKETVN